MPLYLPANAPGTGNVATDTIWDAAGDLAVGSGSNTAAKLTMGALGGSVGRINGAVAWTGGTAFPTAVTDDRFYRSDLDIMFAYDGTRWLSIPPLEETMGLASAVLPFSGTVGGSHRIVAPTLRGGSDLYLTTVYAAFNVVTGGSALSGSHKWVITIQKTGTGTSTTVATINIDSGNSAEWRASSTAINALMNNGTTHHELDATCTKTGTPGNLHILLTIGYRIVAA